MRKLIYSLLTLTLISTVSSIFTSCGSDDTPVETLPVETLPVETPPAVTKPTIELSSDLAQINLGDTVTFTAKLDGEDVTSTAIFYVNEEAIEGNTYTTQEQCEIIVNATHADGEDSEYIVVKFINNPLADILGVGSFTYNGVTKDVPVATLQLEGFYYTDEEQTNIAAFWVQSCIDTDSFTTADNGYSLVFSTDATLGEGENSAIVESYLKPNEGTCTYDRFFGILLDGEVIEPTGANVNTGEQITASINFNQYELTDVDNVYNLNLDVDITGGEYTFTSDYVGTVRLIAYRVSTKIHSYSELKELKNNLFKK